MIRNRKITEHRTGGQKASKALGSLVLPPPRYIRDIKHQLDRIEENQKVIMKLLHVSEAKK